MKPWEILLSESQERMLIVVKKGMEKELLLCFNVCFCVERNGGEQTRQHMPKRGERKKTNTIILFPIIIFFFFNFWFVFVCADPFFFQFSQFYFFLYAKVAAFLYMYNSFSWISFPAVMKKKTTTI